MENKEDEVSSINFVSKVRSYHKTQQDYRTPLDSALNSSRHGANNRSKQTVRTEGEFGVLAKFGE